MVLRGRRGIHRRPVSTGPLIRSLRVEPGKPAGLGDRDPGDYLGFESKEWGLGRLAELVLQIGMLHDRLAAEGRRSLLLVLQGLDASGKDGTVRHVLTGVSPQAWRIVSFKQPTLTELAHDYLWRIHAACAPHAASWESSTARTTRTSSRFACAGSCRSRSGRSGRARFASSNAP